MTTPGVALNLVPLFDVVVNTHQNIKHVIRPARAMRLVACTTSVTTMTTTTTMTVPGLLLP